MYSRQNRDGRDDIRVEIPSDYSGNAFAPRFSQREHAQCKAQKERDTDGNDKKTNESVREEKADERLEMTVNCMPSEHKRTPPCSLNGLSGLLGGNIGLEELLLIGVIFLIFTDEGLRDNELIICLLLILFI